MNLLLCHGEYVDFSFSFTYYFGKAYSGLAKNTCV